MKHIKTYEEISLKKALAGTAIGLSLLVNDPVYSEDFKKANNTISKLDIKTNKDPELDKILSEIKSNFSSTDEEKYKELYDKLTNHLNQKYGYVPSQTEIPKLEEVKNKDLSINEIIGWLGSICLAICGIPQAISSIKDKHSHGISWGFVLLWAFGELFALTYVFEKLDAPLLLNYGINMLIVGIILYYKINPKVDSLNEAQIWKSKDALRWLSQIYKIEDSVNLTPFRDDNDEGSFYDFLVPVDDFLKLAKEHNGSFAGNFFDSIEHFEEMINYIKDNFSKEIYVAPFWMSRDVKDIVEFGDVYADTIYIVDNGKIRKSDFSDYSPDEFFKMESKYKKRTYIRIWWD